MMTRTSTLKSRGRPAKFNVNLFIFPHPGNKPSLGCPIGVSVTNFIYLYSFPAICRAETASFSGPFLVHQDEYRKISRRLVRLPLKLAPRYFCD